MFSYHSQRQLIRCGSNSHRYIGFCNGKLVDFTTNKDDLFNLAALFGWFNQGFGFLLGNVSQVLLGILLLWGLCQSAYALPQGYQVVAGEVEFKVTDTHLIVTSSTQKAIIEYETFNVGHGEGVQFILPDGSASILNRVVGGAASRINGSIQSNGQVLIVNPAGIHMGNQANIQTGGFLASTLNLSNQNYMDNTWVLEHFEGKGVTNKGTIQAKDYVVLAGAHVNNEGMIIAPEGKITLAVGDEIRVNVTENVALSVTVDQGLKNQVDDLQAAIINSGTIEGHHVELQAKLKENLFASTVNQDGVIIANTVKQEAGKISIVAESEDPDLQPTIVKHSGQSLVNASETDDAGTIDIQADIIEHRGVLKAEGSHNKNGGKIDIVSRQRTFLASDSEISVRGKGENSNSGEAFIWSDKDTVFDQRAIIDARGGELSGDGGFVEVSGAETVLFKGQAFGGATNGQNGHILIDPINIVIANGGAYDPQAGQTFDGFSSITLQATNDITVNSAFDTAIATGLGNVDLTLEAGNDITVNAPLTTMDGHIRLLADSDADGTGDLNINATVSSGNGDISLNGDTVDINNTVDAGTGTVFLKASTSTPDITVGGGTDNNDLTGVRFDLSGAEMDRISADAIEVGDGLLTNDIRLLGNLDVSSSVIAGGFYDLIFITGGNFDASGRSISLGSDTQSLLFDGNNDYLAIEDLFFNTANSIDELTIVTWMKMSNYQRSSLVDFDRSEHFSFGVNFPNAGGNDGKISFDTYATSGGIQDFASNTRIDDGQWKTVAGRFDSSAINDKAIFINGVKDAETNQYNTGVNLGKNVTRYGIVGDGSEAGSFNGGRNNTYFRGEMQGVHIYDRALTDTELADLHVNGPQAGNAAANILLGYDFTTGGGGNTVSDFSGNGYDGQLFNNPAWLAGHSLHVEAGGSATLGAINSNGQSTTVLANQNITTTGNIQGQVTLKADYNQTNVGNLTVGAIIDSAGKDINLSGAQIDISQLVNAGKFGDIEIQPSVSKAINLGNSVANNDSAILFDLDAGELANLTGNQLTIGDNNLNHDISLMGGLDLSGLKGTDGGAFDLTLTTNQSFNANGYDIFLGRDSLYLDGVDDYLAIQNIFYNSQSIDELTVAAWIRTDNPRGTILDFDRSEHFSFGIDFLGTQGDGQVSWDTNAGTYETHDFVSTTRVDDNNWHFVVATFDANAVIDKAIYIDGGLNNQIDGHTDGNNLGNNNTRYGFVGDGSEATGFDGTRNSIYFGGQLDEIQLFDRALTAPEIAALYNNGLGEFNNLPTADLTIGYNFESDTGSSIVDYSGNGNNGVLNSSAQQVASKNLIINAGQSANLASIAGDGSDITVNANLNQNGGRINESGEIRTLGNGEIELNVLADPPQQHNFDPDVLHHDQSRLPSGSNTNLSNQRFGVSPNVELTEGLLVKLFNGKFNNPISEGINIGPQALIGPPERLGPDNNTLLATSAYEKGRYQFVKDDNQSIGYQVNTDENIVNVINHNAGEIIATIPVGKSPRNIAVSNDQAYVTNSDDNTLSIFDTDTNEIKATVPVGGNPRSVAVSEQTQTAYVANFAEQSVSVVATETHQVIDKIIVGEKPVDIAVSPDGEFAYVAHLQDKFVTVIDCTTREIITNIQVDRSNSDLLLSKDGTKAYLADPAGGAITVIDLELYTMTETIQFKNKAPYGLSFSEDGGQLYFADQHTQQVYAMNLETYVVATEPVRTIHRGPLNRAKIAER